MKKFLLVSSCGIFIFFFSITALFAQHYSTTPTEVFSCTTTPSNDDCNDAIELFVLNGTNFPTSGTTCNASFNANEAVGCWDRSSFNQSVWYKFTATSVTHYLYLNKNSSSNCPGASGINCCFPSISVFRGSSGCAIVDECGLASCQGPSDNSDPQGLTLTGLTIGAVYYAEVYYSSSGTCGTNATYFIWLSKNAPTSSTPCELPIVLVEFSVHYDRIKEVVLLKWITASEINNDRFEIERSIDALYFEKIGQIAGQGNTSTETRYEYADQYPVPGISYYRLKQVDFDGRYEYLGSKSVFCTPHFFLTSTNSAISVYSETAGELFICDVVGRIVEIRDIPIGDYSLKLNLPPGVYMYRFIPGDGAMEISGKFIQ